MKNITKTTKTILFASLLAAMILPFSGMMMADAAPNENANEKAPPNSMKVLDISEFEGEIPELINENALNGLKIAVANNPQVKGLLGDDYEFSDTAQRQTENDGWQPILNYYTDDRKYTVTVVMDKGKVVSAEKYENVAWTHLRAYAIDGYDDSRYTVSGVAMLADVPDYDYDTGVFTALLLNAQKSNSVEADVCDSDESPDSYWAQIGMQFDSNDVRIGYTDTLKDCVPAFFPIPFSTGDSMIYRIYIDDSTNVWTLFVNNLDDSTNNGYAFSRTVSGSSTLDTDTLQTSVWFENSNYPSNGWDAGFASDPVIDYASFQWTNGNWYYWGGEDQTPLYCDSGTTVSDIMSGTFVRSPHDVTFDVSGIEFKCDA